MRDDEQAVISLHMIGNDVYVIVGLFAADSERANRMHAALCNTINQPGGVKKVLEALAEAITERE